MHARHRTRIRSDLHGIRRLGQVGRVDCARRVSAECPRIVVVGGGRKALGARLSILVETSAEEPRAISAGQGCYRRTGVIDLLVDVRQIASRLGVGEDRVRRWIEEGEFPNAVDLGAGSRHFWRVPTTDVDAFVNGRRVGSTPAPMD